MASAGDKGRSSMTSPTMLSHFRHRMSLFYSFSARRTWLRRTWLRRTWLRRTWLRRTWLRYPEPQELHIYFTMHLCTAPHLVPLHCTVLYHLLS